MARYKTNIEKTVEKVVATKSKSLMQLVHENITSEDIRYDWDEYASGGESCMDYMLHKYYGFGSGMMRTVYGLTFDDETIAIKMLLDKVYDLMSPLKAYEQTNGIKVEKRVLQTDITDTQVFCREWGCVQDPTQLDESKIPSFLVADYNSSNATGIIIHPNRQYNIPKIWVDPTGHFVVEWYGRQPAVFTTTSKLIAYVSTEKSTKNPYIIHRLFKLHQYYRHHPREYDVLQQKQIKKPSFFDLLRSLFG